MRYNSLYRFVSQEERNYIKKSVDKALNEDNKKSLIRRLFKYKNRK